MARILVIDDDEMLRHFVVALLEGRNHRVQSTNNGKDGIRLASEIEFDLVITDIVMPGTEGLETIQRIRHVKPDLKILAMSGGGRNKGDYLHYAARLGADGTVAKPFDPLAFLDVVAGLA
jgi:DNA-binding response OmpR family regulator